MPEIAAGTYGNVLQRYYFKSLRKGKIQGKKHVWVATGYPAGN